mgnify:FL=1
MNIVEMLAQEMHLKPENVKNVVELIDEGCTIPFIARYRKERTGSMDDQVLRLLSERLEYLRQLEERKGEIAKALGEQGVLSAELQKALDAAKTLTEAEDIYRPYRPKRRTRAAIAREKGLSQLAESIKEQTLGNPKFWAKNYVTDEMDEDAALSGALDILAEEISDDAAARKQLREVLQRTAVLHTEAADPEKQSVYTMYYGRTEPLARVPAHRALAINRGEKEGFLRVSVEADDGRMEGLLRRRFVKASNPSAQLVGKACDDAFGRLMMPSLERELRNDLTESAQEQAISVFASNLRALLLQPPMRGRVTLGLDPAYRTGCKIAVVDPTGKVLDTAVVYPTPPQKRIEDAERTLTALIRRHGVTAIAIGNGTASREAEQFVCGLIEKLGGDIGYVMVSEAGASVYSASPLAAAEFPQYDVSLRSAVSIARRLQDPLAELIKIDPKAIGVGQYQHDMPQKRLGQALDGVVEDCVNAVGVDLNTASCELLSRVSGLSTAVSHGIVSYREENGPFRSRRELLKVPKLGKKTFEQCAGFLRIVGGEEPLDGTAIHPESYAAAGALLTACGCRKKVQKNGSVPGILKAAEEKGFAALSAELAVGEPTLRDIAAELERPGRDLRDDLPQPVLRRDVLSMADLQEGMELTGTVRNVVDFGAFVDIGVHEDGLVHVSQFPTRVSHPSQAVRVGDVVKVRVLSVDQQKKRIALTMRPKDAL